MLRLFLVLAVIISMSSAPIRAADVSIPYEVRIGISFLDGSHTTISEVWESYFYKNLFAPHVRNRVFGEALNFSHDGKEYFFLKRYNGNASAGSFDFLRECVGIGRDIASIRKDMQAFQECDISSTFPMLVEVDDEGVVERIPLDMKTGRYGEMLTIGISVHRTTKNPDVDNYYRYPWINDLPEYEDSSITPPIPEEGIFATDNYYLKDFMVR